MNQLQFAKKVASETGVSVSEAKSWISAIFNILTEQIMTQDRVVIMNFGTFRRKNRAPLIRGDLKNPGKKIEYPEKTVVCFDVSSYLECMAEEDFPLKK